MPASEMARGRRVGGSSDCAGDLGEAEVEDLHRAVGMDEDVLGLEVAVDDAARVRGGEAARDLRRPGERPAAGHRAAGEQVGERLPFEQLGDEVGRRVRRSRSRGS